MNHVPVAQPRHPGSALRRDRGTEEMADSFAVYLIGGAPGVGKSTLGRELAARIGAASLSADDLMIAAKRITTAQSHPGLHIMSRLPYAEYFTTSSVEQLKADAILQHDAVWPAIESVV